MLFDVQNRGSINVFSKRATVFTASLAKAFELNFKYKNNFPLDGETR